MSPGMKRGRCTAGLLTTGRIYASAPAASTWSLLTLGGREGRLSDQPTREASRF